VAQAGADAIEAYINDTNHAWATHQSNKTEGWWFTDAAMGVGTYSIHAERTDGDANTDGEAFGAADRVTITSIGEVHGVTAIVKRVIGTKQDDGIVNVLFVLNNQAAPTAGSQDETKAQLMADWGFGVAYISSQANQVAFDAAIASADVAYITENVFPGDVNTKLTDAAIGVVNEEQALADELKMSSSNFGYTATYMTLRDNTHPITSGMALGHIHVTTGNAALIAMTGSKAPGMQVLADSDFGSQYVQLGVLETGAALLGGGAAAGRRVTLPWGGNAFDVDLLSADGETIMRRSIQWASGVIPMVDVLLVVSSPGDVQAGGRDEARYNQLLDWGYGVTVMDDDSAQAQFDEMFLAHDVVYVSENADWWKLRPKLASSPIGVVSESPALTMFLGFSWSSSTSNGTNIPITDNTHPITEGFAIGDLQIASSSTSLGYLRYAKAAALRPLAQYKAGSVDYYVQLATVEVGGALYGANGAVGGNAVGRRVSLPWGGGSFDFTKLNANGLSILQRSLDWGGEKYRGPIAHWKFDEPANGGGLASKSYIRMYGDNALIDSYDSTLGVYGGANVSSEAAVSSNLTTTGNVALYGANSQIKGDAYARTLPSQVTQGPGTLSGKKRTLLADVEMDDQVAPVGMPPSQGYPWIDSDITWSADQSFTSLLIHQNAVVTIDGDIRVWCDGAFIIRDTARIEFTPGSTLTLYIRYDANFRGNSVVNTSDHPERMTLITYNTSHGVTLLDNAQLSAVILADRGVALHGDAQLFGSIRAGYGVALNGNSQVHLDTALPSAGAVGSVAEDSITTHHGNYANVPTLGVTGAVDTAVSFDGIDDHVEVAHNSALSPDAGTVAFWFKPADTAGHQAMFSKDSTHFDTGGHLHIYLLGNRLYIRIQDTNTSYMLDSGASTITVGNWHHAAFTFGPNGAKLYLDGTQVDTDAYTGGMGTSSGGIGNFEPLVLGAGSWKSDDLVKTPLSFFFEGSMDDVRMYQRQLTASEINMLANP